MKRIVCIATMGAIVLLACAPPQSADPETGNADAGQAEAIAARSAAWEEAANNGDLEALMALYDDDARILSPDDTMKQGRAAVESAFGAMIDSGTAVDLEQVEIDVVGDLGYQVGTLTVRSADGETLSNGKFVEIWRQKGGEWKIVNDIWNYDPAPDSGAGNILMITHEVEDSDRWMEAWRGPDSRHELFKQHGVADVKAFQSPDAPERKGLLVTVDDMDAWQEFMSSEESAKAKAEDTVKDETLSVLVPVE